jgi:shikimate dehydrogenase
MSEANGFLTGVLGWPIEHSLSPKLHRFWIRHYGMKGYYVPLAVELGQARKALGALSALGFRGVNLTMPHKREALKIVDDIDPLAKRVGAINTIVVHNDGELEGLNTDVFGFTENLKQAGSLPHKSKAVVIGSGGAARAVLIGLHQMGFKNIHVLCRDLEKSKDLEKQLEMELRLRSFSDLDASLSGADLLVNATPLGMAGADPLNIELKNLPPWAWVTDMVYQPLKTELLKKAEEKGNKIVDGLGTLIYQAIPAFKSWFGLEPEVGADLRSYLLEDQ